MQFILLQILPIFFQDIFIKFPDNKVHGANMGPTWVLSSLCGPDVSPMNLAIRVIIWLPYVSEETMKDMQGSPFLKIITCPTILRSAYMK